MTHKIVIAGHPRDIKRPEMLVPLREASNKEECLETSGTYFQDGKCHITHGAIMVAGGKYGPADPDAFHG